MKNLSIVVPIVTPCTRAGAVDVAGAKAVCQALLSSGCTGIFIAGSTGRGPWFSRDDRARVCRALADQIGADTSLLAGCMASGLADMVANAQAMADAGAQVVVVTAPGYFKYSPAEIETLLLKFADASPLPVMLYDIPGFAGVKLEWAMIPRLARHGNIIGMKDSTAEFSRFQPPIALLDECPDFYLLQGKERYLVDSLLAGAKGFVVSMLHIDPRPYVGLYQATRSGNMERARHLQAAICQAMDLFEETVQRRPQTSTFFHFLNWTLRHRRMCDNILLGHEGDCPPWVVDSARQTLEIYDAAISTQP